MKKTLVAFLVAAVVIFSFSSVSWAVERPNTPECTDINGSFDADECLLQFINPLIFETIELYNRLMKLQGKNPAENPWTFTPAPACEIDLNIEDEKPCLLQMPGKLAQEKYLIREEIRKLEAVEKIKKQKAKRDKTTMERLMEENKKLVDKLAVAEQRMTELSFEANILNGKVAEVAEKDRLISKEQKKFKTLVVLGVVLFALTVGLLTAMIYSAKLDANSSFDVKISKNRDGTDSKSKGGSFDLGT